MNTEQPKPTRVIGYVRVSTEGQAESGLSLDAQRAKLTAYAQAMDLELVDVVVDAGASAKTLNRPGLARVLAALDAGDVDGVLVAKLDRLTRSVRDLGELVDRYFARDRVLLSVADSIDTRSASGRLVLNVLTSVAQWEREAIGERTRDALRQLRGRGVRLGAAPLEGPAVERMRALRAEGATLKGIATTLEAEGYATKKGGRWAPATVHKVLHRTAVLVVGTHYPEVCPAHAFSPSRTWPQSSRSACVRRTD